MVEGDVEMHVTGDIDIAGVLFLAPDSSLKIYVDGDFTVIGNSAAIANRITSYNVCYTKLLRTLD